MVVQLVTLLMKFFAFTFSKLYAASVTEFLKKERKCDKEERKNQSSAHYLAVKTFHVQGD